MALTHDDYTVAWICALPLEIAAASVMLDKTHNRLPQPSTDPNAYILGELNGYYIIIACLPGGIYGTISASTIMAHMVSTFPRVQFGLMVGIGGGVPSPSNDIRLGDVVVSKPVGRYSGVIQYDYGKAVQGGQFEPTGILNKPPQTLLTHMAHLEASQMTRREDTIFTIVRDVLDRYPDMKDRFSPRNQQSDYLFHSSYYHADPKVNCGKCDKEQLVCRPPRTTNTPYIHYGLIASGDQVMRDSETRDRLAQQHPIICFEMEAAGLMDGLPTLVIRGICDYCDSHKQKEWQGYAALTAAAYAKLLLSAMPVSRMNQGLTKDSSRVGPARNPKAHQSASGHPMYPPMSRVGSDHAGTRGTSEQSSPLLGAYSICGESHRVYGRHIDLSHQVQISPGEFFVVGRVFAILWYEGRGQQGTAISDFISQDQFTRGRFGEKIFSRIRRMVVVKAMSESAWCVAITTYGGQGVAKPGVNPGKHAIIYMQGSMPTRMANEPQMTKEPLEVEPAKPDEKLDEISRLNFSKVYTVEHNVKVRPIGMISWSSMAKFRGYVSNEFRLDI